MLIFLLKTKETAGNLRFPQLNKVGLRQILFDFKLYIGGFSSPFLKRFLRLVLRIALDLKIFQRITS